MSTEIRAQPARRTFRSLRTRSDFDRVFRRGRRVRLGPLAMVVAPGHDGVRVGFKIGKKVGKAHLRNLVRRRLKALLERFTAPAGRGLEVVFVLHTGAAARSFCELERRVRPVLERNGLTLREEFREEAGS